MSTMPVDIVMMLESAPITVSRLSRIGLFPMPSALPTTPLWKHNSPLCRC